MEKIKQFLVSEKGKDVLTVIIVVLVGLTSFGLGRLSKENSDAGIKIEYPNGATSEVVSGAGVASSISAIAPFSKNSTGKAYFASSRGSKYYSTGCSGGKTIKQENRVYFTTSAEAEQAGYELSSTCK